MASHPFVQVPDVTPLLSAPGDFAVVRRCFCFWQSKHRAHGTIVWGRPTEEDVIEVCDLWDAHVRSPYGGDPTLADIRALEWLDVLAFQRLVLTFVERRAEWTPRTGPQAILHGGGYGSAIVLGALQVAGQGYRLGAFDAQGDALAWLGVPEVTADFERLRASLLDSPDVLRRVRATLDESPEMLSAQELAKRLGVSVRSLQRRLAAAGTSLRAERRRHVVARAESLLAGTDYDLAAIAALLGLDSAARLVALFRTVRDTTPGAFRKEAKRDA